jgi:hypothetical protein
MGSTNCTAHCAGCGRHFAGNQAFDMHRRGDPAAGRRYCVAPLEEPRLMVATEDGVCRIGEHAAGEMLTLYPVTVYGLAANRTDAKRAQYAALRRNGDGMSLGRLRRPLKPLGPSDGEHGQMPSLAPGTTLDLWRTS